MPASSLKTANLSSRTSAAATACSSTARASAAPHRSATRTKSALPILCSRSKSRRTIIRKALEEGVGLLSEDIHSDERFSASATLQRVDTRTLLCVPLIGHGDRRLGAVQLASIRSDSPFSGEDLQLLATIGMQV